MLRLLEKKVRLIKKSLINGNYENPFITKNILNIALKINIDIIDKNKIYNNCKPLGFFNNKMCEILYNNDINNSIELLAILSDKHVEHLNLIKTSWNFIPNILVVNDKFEIIYMYDYDIDEPDDSWVSASRTRNYLLDDPLIDYLQNLKNNPSKKRKRESSSVKPDTFLQHIFSRGNNFETEIIDIIKNKYPDNFIQICESYESRLVDKYIATIRAIKQNIDIIYQPVLWNHKNKTFGCADLIIKSSFSKNIFSSYQNNKEEDIYEVYDIKWSNINLKADSDELINDHGIKAYKGQIYIYTDALNLIQKKKATKGYIIGKKYFREKTKNKETLYSSFDTFDKLGIIDYSKDNEIIKKTDDAIEWINEVRFNKKLNHDPPNDPRLFPNMCNTQDFEYNSIKKKLAEKNKEITLLYSIGKKNRDLAFQNHIYRYDDPRLNVDILGLTKTSKKRKLIENIININNNSDKNISYTSLDNFGNWKNAKIKCYVDIETINSSVYNLSHNKPNFIFMIGLGIVRNDKWEFKVYTVNQLTEGEETKILRDFNFDINQLIEHEIPVFHWSNYENTNLKPYLNLNSNIKFYDMCRWFINNEICIKGCLDFKLKNILNSLYKLNLTKIQWSNDIINGSNAMHLSYKFYKEGDIDKLKDIEYYNEIDCKAMWEIHNILNAFFLLK